MRNKGAERWNVQLLAESRAPAEVTCIHMSFTHLEIVAELQIEHVRRRVHYAKMAIDVKSRNRISLRQTPRDPLGWNRLNNVSFDNTPL